MSLDEAQRKCEAWRRDYNEVQPDSATKCLRRFIARPAIPASWSRDEAGVFDGHGSKAGASSNDQRTNGPTDSAHHGMKSGAQVG
jgi:hypothetical protein